MGVLLHVHGTGANRCAPTTDFEPLGLRHRYRLTRSAVLQGSGFGYSSKINAHKIADAFDGAIGSGKPANRLFIQRVMALPCEDGGHAPAPSLFDRGQNAKLVVNEDVMICRVALLDVVQLQFLVDVNEHAALECVVQSGVPYLSWLKDNISVREDGRPAVALDVVNRVQRIREQPVREWVFQQEVR